MKAPLWVGKNKYWQSRFIRLKSRGYTSRKIQEIIREEKVKAKAKIKSSVRHDLQVGAEEMAAAGYPKSVIRANFGHNSLEGLKYE